MNEVQEVISRISYADWLILYFLAQSMNKRNFGALITMLNEELPIKPTVSKDSDFEDEVDDIDSGGQKKGKAKNLFRMRSLKKSQS